ncbi:MAG TPA: DUF5706 domain-containing protein [Fulvivirga sp.]|nr:DUF5706 domain-containing protein [Fulvivirga sp.]
MAKEETSHKPNIVDAAQLHVEELFKEDKLRLLLFHNINHTRQVVDVSKELAEAAGINQTDTEKLLLAAWFHDVGYIEKREGHEEVSARMAKAFLQSQNYNEAAIQEVIDLINSTNNDHKPQHILEEILNDADFAHLGMKKFFRTGELVRAELEAEEDLLFNELDWQKKQYKFLLEHPFITHVAEQEYGKRRSKNIKKQRENKIGAKKITIRSKTGKDFGRGIDTLYRSSYRSHINFSAIADGKANMMISINTILISVIVTLTGASLSFNNQLLGYSVPIIILLISALISVVFAVLSARPKVTANKVTKKAIKNNSMSLMYFGNFLEVSREEFTEYLDNLKKDQQKLYDSMSIDIYNLGIVLKEKYRLLSISYTVFMIGLTLCVIGFLIIFMMTNYL